jgi:hypothetical protein
MSISSTDPIWSALSSYYSEGEAVGARATVGSSPVPGTGSGQTGTSSGLPLSAQAQAATETEVLGGAGPTGAGAPSLWADVLSGQSSAAAAAVSAGVNQNILDALL